MDKEVKLKNGKVVVLAYLFFSGSQPMTWHLTAWPTKKSFSGNSMASVERARRGAKPRTSPNKLISRPS